MCACSPELDLVLEISFSLPVTEFSPHDSHGQGLSEGVSKHLRKHFAQGLSEGVSRASGLHACSVVLKVCALLVHEWPFPPGGAGARWDTSTDTPLAFPAARMVGASLRSHSASVLPGGFVTTSVGPFFFLSMYGSETPCATSVWNPQCRHAVCVSPRILLEAPTAFPCAVTAKLPRCPPVLGHRLPSPHFHPQISPRRSLALQGVTAATLHILRLKI